MADARTTHSLIAEHFEVTSEGVYVDGHRLPVTDEISVEHADPDFHIVSLKLYTKRFSAEANHRVSETPVATYRYVHDATDPQP